MPFTPFHFGPGLLFGVPLRRRLDLATFLAANVAVDARATLVFFGLLDGPLHGPLHTYLGSLGVAAVLGSGTLAFARAAPDLARGLSSRPASPVAVASAAVAGTWLHVTLDAVLYPEMDPLFPLLGNPLYGLTSSPAVYGGCALAFVVGTGLAVRWYRTGRTSRE